MARIELDNVIKRFGRAQIIHGISLDVLDGEFIVIVGPSGCGKSTLLRMVAGLETISEGEIRIAGARVNETEPMDRDIAMVFQNYALYPHMTVRQNMSYSLRVAGASRSEIEGRVMNAARLLQMEEYLSQKPRQLSGGQRQRVAMGRAIVREPCAFLFDEPLSNLDARLRVQMRLEIKELQKRLGITSLYVTHDQVEAMTMADRMVVMNAGVTEQTGTPLEVYERPQTVFAAQFIGSPQMNIIEADLRQGRARLTNGAELACQCSYEGAALVGVRPEHMIADSEGPIGLQVALSEPLGANTLLHGRLAGKQDALTVSLPGVHHVPAGGHPLSAHDLHFSVAPDHVHVFEKASRRRAT